MRILIIVPTFGIGGTIISLHSLLSLIDGKDWHVDVFARKASGEYLEKLPNCQILPENMFISSGIYPSIVPFSHINFAEAGDCEHIYSNLSINISLA